MAGSGETTNAYGLLETTPYYCTLRLSDYNRPDPFSKAEFKANKTIRLPLPLELRDDTSVAYNNVDLQLIGDLMNRDVGSGLGAEGLRQAGALGESITGAAASFMGGVAEAASSVAGGLGAKVLSGGLSNAFQAEQIGSAVQQGMGLAPNPNPSVAFQGPSLREMTLTWTFMPTNEDDSKKIRKLIRTLKTAALPENSFKDSAAILRYPKLCMVNFYPWDNTGGGKFGWGANSIIKMKPAFMASVNANYTAGSAPAFFNGWNNEPVVTQLTISFKEVEYFLADDYDYDQNEGSIPDPVGDALETAVDTITGWILADNTDETDGASDE